MKYIEYVNQVIRHKLLAIDDVVCFGQNVSAGSCLSGLTKGLKVTGNGLVINTPNSENALVGIGFGMMLNEVNSIFFMKQQDFLLLGVEHLVNTYNILRGGKPRASFTIMCIIVDSGYEGPQSALNNFVDFCSIARIPGYAVTSMDDADGILSRHLIEAGFRIIGVSQRMFRQEMIAIPSIHSNNDKSLFQYSKGDDVTITCFNFSLPYGMELQRRLEGEKVGVSLYNVNAMMPIDWGQIVDDLRRTGRLVVFDDSKSVSPLWEKLLLSLGEIGWDMRRSIVIKRKYSESWFGVDSDAMEIDYDRIVGVIRRGEA